MRSTSPAAAPSPVDADRRRWPLLAIAGVGVAALVLASCGGDDDDADSTTTTTTTQAVESATPTTVRTTTTVPTTTTTTLAPVEYVTEGATVVVANASGIDGAAGRLTDRLEIVGFTVAAATNSSETVGNLEVSQIYYVPDDDDARAVADSLREAFGGGDIEVLEVGVPAPTESGELGDATVLVLMGNDIADKSLEELQGRVAPAADDSDDTTDDTTDDGDDDATDDTTADTTDDDDG